MSHGERQVQEIMLQTILVSLQCSWSPMVAPASDGKKGEVTPTSGSIEIQDHFTKSRSGCLKINELFGESSAITHARGPH